MKNIPPSLAEALKKGASIKSFSNKKDIAILNDDDDDDSTICLWNLKNEDDDPELIVKIDKREYFLHHRVLEISKHDHLLVVWDYWGHNILVYNLKSSPTGSKTLSCIQKIKKKYGDFLKIKSVKIIPNTNLIAILYCNDSFGKSRVDIVNTRTNKDVDSFKTPYSKHIEAFPEEMMVIASEDCIDLWDLSLKKPIHSVPCTEIQRLLKISDTQCLVRQTNGVKIYDLKSQELHDVTLIEDEAISKDNLFNYGLSQLNDELFVSVQKDNVSVPIFNINLWKLDKNCLVLLQNDSFPKILDLPKDPSELCFIPNPDEHKDDTWLFVVRDHQVKAVTTPPNYYPGPELSTCNLF